MKLNNYMNFLEFFLDAEIEAINLDEVLYSTPQYQYRWGEQQKLLKDLISRYGDNLYLSFTSIEKLGINPMSTYNTPIGIYAYPASYVLSMTRGGGRDDDTLWSPDQDLPFAGEKPYIQVFTARNPEKVIHCYHAEEYQIKSPKAEVGEEIQKGLLAAHEDNFGLTGAHVAQTKLLDKLVEAFLDIMMEKFGYKKWEALSPDDIMKELKDKISRMQLPQDKEDARIAKYAGNKGFEKELPVPPMPKIYDKSILNQWPIRSALKQLKLFYEGVRFYSAPRNKESLDAFKSNVGSYFTRAKGGIDEIKNEHDQKQILAYIRKLATDFINYHEEQIEQIEVDDTDYIRPENLKVLGQAAKKFIDEAKAKLEKHEFDFGNQKNISLLEKYAKQHGIDFKAIMSDVLSTKTIRSDNSLLWLGTQAMAKENPRKWNTILQGMGIDGFHDHGTKTIHMNEPTQAVFFSTRAIQHVGQIPNEFTSRGGEYASTDIPKEKRPLAAIRAKMRDLLYNHYGDRPTIISTLKQIIKLMRSIKRISPEDFRKEFQQAPDDSDYGVHSMTLLRKYIQYMLLSHKNDPVIRQLTDMISKEIISPEIAGQIRQQVTKITRPERSQTRANTRQTPEDEVPF